MEGLEGGGVGLGGGGDPGDVGGGTGRLGDELLEGYNISSRLGGLYGEVVGGLLDVFWEG